MRTIVSSLKCAALIVAGLLACACTRLPPPTEQTTVKQTSTGVEIVDTIELTAAVVGINYDTRQVVLKGPYGGEVSYRVDKSAVNFGEIKVGDQVKATVTEKLAVFLDKQKAPASAGVAASVNLAPEGAMPGGVVAATSEVTTTVTAVDVKSRKVTLRFVDGTTETVKVGKAVDLSKVSPGDSVTARLTESVAIAVVKT